MADRNANVKLIENFALKKHKGPLRKNHVHAQYPADIVISRCADAYGQTHLPGNKSIFSAISLFRIGPSVATYTASNSGPRFLLM